MSPVTLVLLPALDGTGVFFDPLVACLPSWIRPLVISYPQTGSNDYDTLYKLVELSVQREREFFVLGWSFGGPLALRLAANHPERVRGVILCASFITLPTPFLRPLRLGINGPVIGLVRALWRARFWFQGYHSEQFRAAKAVTWRGVASRVLAERGRAIVALNAKPELATCKAPVMYLAGKQDQVVKPASAEEILRVRPDTKLEHIDGNHYAINSNAVEACAKVTEFIATVGIASMGETASHSEPAVIFSG